MLIINNEKLLNLIKYNYTLEDIQQIFKFLQHQGTFNFPRLPNGLFSAASVGQSTDYTGYQSVWIRDNIYMAYAHYLLGHTDIASTTILSLLTYFQKYRWRFESIIEGQANPQEVMNRPHVRFEGTTLEEINQNWAHAQNDALGYFLWFCCQLVCSGVLKLKSEQWETLALFPFYFQAIQYWQDEDNGHWEEALKIEASSIGTVLAGLQALRQVLLEDSAIECKYKTQSVTIELLDKLINTGRAALAEILPFECIQTSANKNRRYDAALLFLIYPLQVISEDMANQVLGDVINNLQGLHGIRRYRGDSYWCADYKDKLAPEVRTINFSENMAQRDALLNEGEEAQWCLFDPIISIIFGLRFQQNRQLYDLEQQWHYLNRALGQITGAECELGEFKCPESYYLENGNYVPNDATPLLWTQANLMLALRVAQFNF